MSTCLSLSLYLPIYLLFYVYVIYYVFCLFHYPRKYSQVRGRLKHYGKYSHVKGLGVKNTAKSTVTSKGTLTKEVKQKFG